MKDEVKEVLELMYEEEKKLRISTSDMESELGETIERIQTLQEALSKMKALHESIKEAISYLCFFAEKIK